MVYLHRLLIPCAAALAFNAHAGPNFESTIHQIGNSGLVLNATESVPSWMAAGQMVTALGWEVIVREVNGQRVVLDMEASKLKRAKVGDAVSIRQPNSDEPQMCGA